MTQEQINMFGDLLADDTFKGKKQLRHLLWLNTVKPKFKPGDCFIVSDPGHRVYGYPIHNFIGKIINIKSWINEEEYCYELQLDIQCKDKQTTTKVYKRERELEKSDTCEFSVNILPEPLSRYSESIDA